jgi:hypothetical protein
MRARAEDESILGAPWPIAWTENCLPRSPASRLTRGALSSYSSSAHRRMRATRTVRLLSISPPWGGRAWAVGALLRAGASPDEFSGGEGEGTPLCGAACWGHLATVRILLSGGADPNLPEEAGMTPLLWAASGSWDRCVDALLDAGADPDLPDSAGRTALRLAARRGLATVRSRGATTRQVTVGPLAAPAGGRRSSVRRRRRCWQPSPRRDSEPTSPPTGGRCDRRWSGVGSRRPGRSARPLRAGR